MFGTVRFVLALLVALSHIKGSYVLSFGDIRINHGVVAVIGFYIVSGYLMNLIYRTKFKKQKIIHFYLDRFLRIWPQFLFYCLLTIIIRYEQIEINFFPAVSHLVIFPLNYKNYIGESLFMLNGNAILLPATWSLAAELHFYFLVPLLFAREKIIKFVFPLSFFIFSLAVFDVLPGKISGYKLIPGVLFVFLLGHLIYKCVDEKKINVKKLLCMFLSVITVIGLMLIVVHDSVNATIISMSIGLLICFPLILFLAQCPRKKWDEFLGTMSYGIFLNHFIPAPLMARLGLEFNTDLARTLSIIGISVTMSFISYQLIDKNITKIRHKIRNNRIAQSNDSSGTRMRMREGN